MAEEKDKKEENELDATKLRLITDITSKFMSIVNQGVSAVDTVVTKVKGALKSVMNTADDVIDKVDGGMAIAKSLVASESTEDTINDDNPD